PFCVNEHLQASELAHVKVHCLEHTSRLTPFQSTELNAERLLILKQLHIVITQLLLPANARRYHIRYRLTLIILLEVHRKRIEFNRIIRRNVHIITCSVNLKLELPPLITHELKLCKPQHNGIREAGHEHPDESNGFEIGNVTNLRFKLIHRYSKEIPALITLRIVRKRHRYIPHVRNEVITHRHEWLDVDLVLEIFFRFIQCIVTIQLLCVGILGKRIHKLAVVIRDWRVTMWVVDVFITLDNARVIRVECRIAIRLEVIRRRIFQCRWIGCRIIHLQCLEVSLELLPCFFIPQAIKIYVLVLPVRGIAAKRIRYLETIRSTLAPYGVVIVRCVVRRRTKAILILTLSLTQHIF